MKCFSNVSRLLVFVSCLLPVSVWAAEKVTLSTEAFQEVAVEKDGKQQTEMRPVDRVRPGDEVVYILSFANEGDAAANDLVINNPIPEYTRYKANSAFGAGTVVSVSVDNGDHYGNLADLAVSTADGEERPATAEDVSHVRWTVNYALQPGKIGTVSYRVVVQ